MEEFYDGLGGCYVAEMLRGPLEELKEAFEEAVKDELFFKELEKIRRDYIGRPTPLLYAENATKELGGASLYIKVEGLANTGAHKINNAAGQILLARRMGKKKIIAETGAGQHGVATAAMAARLNMPCRIYMGSEDIRRQRPNVYWMELYGAEVCPVDSGERTLKDAVNEALRYWAGHFEETHYVLGSALGPAPYPAMVKFFQSVIGEETKQQLAERNLKAEAMIACVGGGSNAIGFFSPWLEEEMPRLYGVEAGGQGPGKGEHAVRMSSDQSKIGILQGYKSYFLLDDDGNVLPTHSVSAGLDYPGIGPELAAWGQRGRIRFTRRRDDEALEALRFFARREGLVFALESAHAGAEAIVQASQMKKGEVLVVHMSGRGDKDIFISAPYLDKQSWRDFLKREASS